MILTYETSHECRKMEQLLMFTFTSSTSFWEQEPRSKDIFILFFFCVCVKRDP